MTKTEAYKAKKYLLSGPLRTSLLPSLCTPVLPASLTSAPVSTAAGSGEVGSQGEACSSLGVGTSAKKSDFMLFIKGGSYGVHLIILRKW